MSVLYKAVGRDYTSRGGLVWRVGTVVTHPTSIGMIRDAPTTYLSFATAPAATLVGRGWPCRLMRVEPIGDVIDSCRHPHKRCALAATVMAELPGWQALGPQGRQVAALIDLPRSATDAQLDTLTASTQAIAQDAARYAARDAAHSAAQDAARRAARDAARNAAQDAVGYVTWDAARWAARWAAGALVVRDLITPEQYQLLAGLVHTVFGPAESWPVPAWCDEVGPDEAMTA